MNRRQYFAAHAPAEPQPWFKPVMTSERPTAPMRPCDFTAAEHDELGGWGDALDTADLTQPRVRAYAESFEKFRAESREWDSVQAREFYLQWPFAWADEMMKRGAGA